jgi:hypothetical protein
MDGLLMDRFDYQNLRFTVESQIVDLDNGVLDRDAVINGVMRAFLQAVATSQVKRASAKRAFRTFRRDSEKKPPSWAFRKPGISSRLPTL